MRDREGWVGLFGAGLGTVLRFEYGRDESVGCEVCCWAWFRT